jgi:K+-sensing histidine kinase KdpD
MIVHDRVIGAISLHSYSINAYTSEHISLLSGVVNQVAITIENARLYETSQARAEQLATLNEIGRSISTLLDLNGVLESAYHLLRHVLALDSFYIALYHPESQMISYPIVIDEGKKWSEEPFTLIPETLMAKTILTGEPYLVNRSSEEIARRQASLESQNTLGDSSKVSASLMIAPLKFGGKVLGVISTQSYKLDAYTSDDLELLTGAATQVAIAIENARLYTALQKELTERKRAEAEVRKLNAELEARVRLRTKELEAANKELASFTYTVSHDLRAPIRGVHGLTHIVLEEFENELPAKAVTHIKRIQSNAQQMGRLIDELLAFTHLGRQPLRPTNLDMMALSHAVIGELMKKETRRIDFSVQGLPEAYGDYALIRQVFTNLLSNAIKFTNRQESPQVEIGSLQQNGETVYFIRDNGVGFDMAYAGKLFGVFERLHRQDEFEGIGVGLAIVRRIITRHGGRVWAEGKVNQGATFFFMLPAKPSKRENRK